MLIRPKKILVLSRSCSNFMLQHVSRVVALAFLVDKENNVQDAIDVAYKAYDSIIARNKGKDQYRFYVWVETSGTGPPSVWKT